MKEFGINFAKFVISWFVKTGNFHKESLKILQDTLQNLGLH